MKLCINVVSGNKYEYSELPTDSVRFILSDGSYIEAKIGFDDEVEISSCGGVLRVYPKSDMKIKVSMLPGVWR